MEWGWTLKTEGVLLISTSLQESLRVFLKSTHLHVWAVNSQQQQQASPSTRAHERLWGDRQYFLVGITGVSWCECYPLPSSKLCIPFTTLRLLLEFLSAWWRTLFQNHTLFCLLLNLFLTRFSSLILMAYIMNWHATAHWQKDLEALASFMLRAGLGRVQAHQHVQIKINALHAQIQGLEMTEERSLVGKES